MPRSSRRIVDTGTPMRKLDPDAVAKALGAEPIPPSKAMLQMTVMDLEFEGPMSSFDALCQALAEKHKVHVDVVKTVMFSGVRTKTPRGSAVKQPWEGLEQEDDPRAQPARDFIPEEHRADWDAQQAQFDEDAKQWKAEKAKESAPKPPKKRDPIPEANRSEPERPLEKCLYSDRYKQEWMKWYELGKADKAAGKPQDLEQLPKWTPQEEVLRDYQQRDKPLFQWQSAYLQGYEDRQGDFIYAGMWVPTEKARGMTRAELWEKSMTDRDMIEDF